MVAASSLTAAALTPDQAVVVTAVTAGLIVLTGLAVMLGRSSTKGDPPQTRVRSWTTLALAAGLVLLSAVTFAFGSPGNPALRSTAAGALIAIAGAAVVSSSSSKTAGQASHPASLERIRPRRTPGRSRVWHAVATGAAFAAGAGSGLLASFAATIPLQGSLIAGLGTLAVIGLALNGAVTFGERRPRRRVSYVLGESSEVARNLEPLPEIVIETRTEAPKLFWNTLFPEDRGILLHQPHVIVAQAEYLVETGLGPEAVRGAESSPQEAAGLLNKQIRYQLEAENGEFRSEDSTEWNIKAVSAPMACTETGTDAFRVVYRADHAGRAAINAFLIVDNGSVDEQEIELRVLGNESATETIPQAVVSAAPGRSVGRSVASALSPDYRFVIREFMAELWHENNKLVDIKLPSELARQLTRVAAEVYQKLRDVSRDLQSDRERPLRLINSDEGKLRLAKAGAELHYRLFRVPDEPIDGSMWKGIGAIADRLGNEGSETDPPLLQIDAHDFPLPWGLLYDKSADGGEDLRTADDVDPAGFWGRRFDIYRSVVSVDIYPQRGQRRWVKPVVGAEIRRGQEQREFLDGLRQTADDALIYVDSTSLTVDEFMNWATSGKDSDLVYLFCHAVPKRYSSPGAGVRDSWLGFGSSETDDRDEMWARLSQLETWWRTQRPTNPVVVLNACSSGQEDAIYGAPFANFFMKKWGAQAFIGTDWPINASFADAFGQDLLTELLLHRRSLRDAVRVVSDKAASESNYLPLIYAVYGSSTVQFTSPAPGLEGLVKSALRMGPP